MRLTIGSRKSDLARVQAYQVGECLKAKYPNLEIEFDFSPSFGDLNLDVSLTALAGKGVFTQDFHEKLCSGEVDLVVHSWKDLPIEDRDGCEIVATLPREDMRDMILFPSATWEKLEEGSCLSILSSSPRREYNLKNLLPKLLPKKFQSIDFKPVRGNVPTRLSKLFSNEGHALVVAKAAIDRLMTTSRPEFIEMRDQLKENLRQCLWMVLPLKQNPCAPAQGALAVEVASSSLKLKNMLKEISCFSSWEAVIEERKILASYGGGCHQKIGASVLNRSYGSIVSLRGKTEDGRTLNRFQFLEESKRGVESWPKKREMENWFHRKHLPLDDALNLKLKTQQALWIAKSEALPDSYVQSPGQILWTGGTKTWETLATRGHWVSGCSESLGEKEDERLVALVGEKIDWLKLTHSGAEGISDKETIATYRLEPIAGACQVKGYSHYFWMSGSQFLHALSLYPDIVTAHHSCGPGNTYNVVREKVDSEVEVFLSRDHWEACLEVVPR